MEEPKLTAKERLINIVTKRVTELVPIKANIIVPILDDADILKLATEISEDIMTVWELEN